jgi:hypothetical protein
MTTSNDVIAKLTGGSVAERRAAVARMPELGGEVVPTLIRLLDEEPSIWIWDALAAIGPPAAGPVLQRHRLRGGALGQGEARVLGQDPAAWDVIRGASRSRDEGSRESAAVALGILGGPEAVSLLRAALRDVDPGVRQEAALALGAFSDDAVVDDLIEATNDRDEEVRGKAVAALGDIATPLALERVVTCLDDPDVRVRIFAIDAVRRARVSQAAPMLIERLKVADPGIGTGTEIGAICDALRVLAVPSSAAGLIEFLSRPYAGWRADPKGQIYGDDVAAVLDVLGTSEAVAAASAWRNRPGSPASTP